MGLGRCLAVTLDGLTGHVVEVEADVAPGLPAFVIVGLPDTALHEARDRVRAALRNVHLDVPDRRVTVNLSPASLRKAGTGFDLAVAVAVLAAAGWVEAAPAARTVHLGELSLDGRLRPVRGVLPALLAARAAGCERVVVPAGNAAEAALVPGLDVVVADHLAQVVREHGGDADDPPEGPEGEDAGARGPGQTAGPSAPGASPRRAPAPAPDLADVLGQHEARTALEVAAAGGHHLLLLGPPGVGKSMLAARLPGLLPDLTAEEALEVTAVHSVAGTADLSQGLLTRPPFEDPHHTATAAAVLGGGRGTPAPGAVSRAHRGVLLLDEGPEFARPVLDGLREPLESGELVIARSGGTVRFPARFQLVLAANPCPCGRSVGKGLHCTCTSLQRRQYLARLSGPLLDRVDLQVQVDPVSRAALAAASAGPRPEGTAVVAARVASARAAARERLAGTPWHRNADVPGSHLREALRLPRATVVDLEAAQDRSTLTMRGADRVLRVAWSLADLAGTAAPDRDQLGRALLWRLGAGHGAGALAGGRAR